MRLRDCKFHNEGRVILTSKYETVAIEKGREGDSKEASKEGPRFVF